MPRSVLSREEVQGGGPGRKSLEEMVLGGGPAGGASGGLQRRWSWEEVQEGGPGRRSLEEMVLVGGPGEEVREEFSGGDGPEKRFLEEVQVEVQ